MDMIINLIVGGIIGWLASLVMKTGNQMGMIANIVVGIIGSGLGAWVFALVGLAAYGTLGRLLMGVVGAALLIALLRGLGFYK